VELFRLGFLGRAIHRSCDCRGAKEEDQATLLTATVTESANFLTTSRHFRVFYPKETSMLARNILSVLRPLPFFCVLRGSTNELQPICSPKWPSNRGIWLTLAMGRSQGGSGEQLSKKDAVDGRAIQSRVGAPGSDRNAYFHKDEAPVLAALTRGLVPQCRPDQDKPALAILEMAEDDYTYWKALDQTKDWGANGGFRSSSSDLQGAKR